MNDYKAKEKEFLKKIKTEMLCGGNKSVFDLVTVFRFVRFFPSRGNQESRRIVAYESCGSILKTYPDSTMIGIPTLRSILPKRITVIEDNEYMSKKDFDFYS